MLRIISIQDQPFPDDAPNPPPQDHSDGGDSVNSFVGWGLSWVAIGL